VLLAEEHRGCVDCGYFSTPNLGFNPENQRLMVKVIVKAISDHIYPHCRRETLLEAALDDIKLRFSVIYLWRGVRREKPRTKVNTSSLRQAWSDKETLQPWWVRQASC
jgi:hypothetical protein